MVGPYLAELERELSPLPDEILSCLPSVEENQSDERRRALFKLLKKRNAAALTSGGDLTYPWWKTCLRSLRRTHPSQLAISPSRRKILP